MNARLQQGGTLALLGLLAAAPGFAQESRTYHLGGFDMLEVSGVVRIELAQGDRDQVVVIGDDAVQRSVQMSIAGGQLQVHTQDGWKFWSREPVQLQVQVRELSRITISGASNIDALRPLKVDTLSISISGQGKVRLDEVNATGLRFDISGAGDASVGGQAQDLRLSVSGKGKLMAERLKTARATLDISGIGNAEVWVTDELRVGVSGIGEVSYWGQPRVQRSASGIANIRARGDKKL